MENIIFLEKKSTRGGISKVSFFWSIEMKKLHYHKKEYPFASKYHYHMYIFDNSYPNYDKTRNPPITFQAGIFQKVLGVELFFTRNTRNTRK